MTQSAPLRLPLRSSAELSGEFESNWVKGRAFVPGSFDLGERSRASLIIVNEEDDSTFELSVEVVWVKRDDPVGVGVAFSEYDDPARLRLKTFCIGKKAAPVQFHDKVRSLSTREQLEWARRGTLSERVALERVYGNAIWEPLLSNPQITAPEVARIAGKGSLPVPLVTAIAGNASWLAQGEVQRALLGNPRVTGQNLTRVLRALSPNDLKRVPSQTAYRPVVRSAALALLKPKA